MIARDLRLIQLGKQGYPLTVVRRLEENQIKFGDVADSPPRYRRSASKCCLCVNTREGKSMDASISPKQLQDERKSTHPPIVIDVRREQAFLVAPDMITGALRRDPATVETWAKELSSAVRVVVYCVHGHEVSQNAAQSLRKYGLQAQFVEGGLEAWRSIGGELMCKPV
jgi:thiosulfate sulfurtransferase